MIVLCMLLSQVMVGAPALDNSMPLKITGAWAVEVGPGQIMRGETPLLLKEASTLNIAPAEVIQIRGEHHPRLPIFNPKAAPWRKGAKLKGLITQECSATGKLYPQSVRIKRVESPTDALARAKDYELEGFWATFGRIEGGAIGAEDAVLVDYDYSPDRLDSIIVTSAGAVEVLPGLAAVGVVLPPAIPEGAVEIARLWVPGQSQKLTEESLYPISFAEASKQAAGPSIAEEFLPKTLKKLQAGEAVSIIAFGDSVTCGGGVGKDTSLWYQHRFLKALQERFPKAQITLQSAGWGGASSNQYMTAPAGGEHDYVRDVLDPKADLVTIEFVNDAGLRSEALDKHYGKILADLRGAGSEVALITPHLVRPDWMGVESQKVDADPRPYVRDLKAFAAKNQVAVADASAGWCRLWREGYPYMTLLANSINHPDERGHGIFVDALMGMFPKE